VKTALETIRDYAKARGITPAEVVEELEHEVHVLNVANPDYPLCSDPNFYQKIAVVSEAKLLATSLFGAFYDSKVHTGSAKVPVTYPVSKGGKNETNWMEQETVTEQEIQEALQFGKTL
jgi:hypothetical protein